MGYTPLHIASSFGYSEVVDRLIAARAMVNTADEVLPRTRFPHLGCWRTPNDVRGLLRSQLSAECPLAECPSFDRWSNHLTTDKIVDHWSVVRLLITGQIVDHWSDSQE